LDIREQPAIINATIKENSNRRMQSAPVMSDGIVQMAGAG
jgi:hypothetical protein